MEKQGGEEKEEEQGPGQGGRSAAQYRARGLNLVQHAPLLALVALHPQDLSSASQ